MMRNEFLSDTWKRYPICPKGSLAVGRLRELKAVETSSSDFITGYVVELERETVRTKHHFENLALRELPEAGIQAVFKVLSAGDWIAVQPGGVVWLLSPARKSLPARKFQPELLKLWQDYVFWMHQFFREKGFLEVSTPSLVPGPGTEPTLDPFTTQLQRGSQSESLTLPTSPELHLKKALALGAEKIYEIRRCFRNGEITNHHQPEFTMIEWYRSFTSLKVIQQDVQDLISYLTKKIPGLRKPAGIDIRTVRALFEENCDFTLQPETSLQELQTLAEKWGVDVSAASHIDDYFFLLFLEKIEKNFVPERMTFVEDYPPYQAALARLSKDGWGERFEMYWQGLEIANAFHELNDPEIQKQRFSEDLKKKALLGKEAVKLDDEFMQCLEAGLPPASGIALGVERLFMALTGVQEISETRLFPMQ
jgi:lysyl-tRNA synthetase class 2